MARTCALILPFQPALHPLSCSNETMQNAPNTMKCTKSWVYGPMGWTGCVRCEKFPMRLHGTNLSFSCTSSTHFALRFV